MKESYSKERFKRAAKDVDESKANLSDKDKKRVEKSGKAGMFIGVEGRDGGKLGVRFQSQEAKAFNRDLDRKDALHDAAHEEATEVNDKHAELKRAVEAATKALNEHKREKMRGGE